MRLFFFLLVLVNLLFFAWAQGYFGASDDEREPQRLAQQLNADKLSVVPPGAAAPAKPPLTECRRVDGLTLAEAEALKSAVEAGGGEAKLLPLAEPPLYFVVIGDLPNQAAAQKKSAELVRLGVTEHSAVALEGGRHEIGFGRFATEAAANELLAGLARRGIKSARVEAREPPAVKAALETRVAAATPLPPLLAPHAAATLGDCATVPSQ